MTALAGDYHLLLARVMMLGCRVTTRTQRPRLRRLREQLGLSPEPLETRRCAYLALPLNRAPVTRSKDVPLLSSSSNSLSPGRGPPRTGKPGTLRPTRVTENTVLKTVLPEPSQAGRMLLWAEFKKRKQKRPFRSVAAFLQGP